MVAFTANLKLRVPVFDQDPWDEDMNSNLYVLDSAVGKFFGVANLVGIWLNDTAYTAGQTVVDNTDGSMWTCNIGHTSATTPTTFSADRVAHPSYWTESISTAQEYAQAASVSASSAAISATNAANSATDAANSAAIVSGALPLTGGTMTGDLILNANPTNVLGAATKQYVDAQVGGVGYLPLTGGTLTGALTLPGNPISALQAAPKQYVDLMMPKTGGIFTGSVSVSGNLTTTNVVQAYNSLQLTISGSQLSADGSNVGLIWDSALWKINYNRSSRTVSFIRGSDNAVLLNLDGSGNGSFMGTVSGAAVSSSNSFTMFSNVNTSWLRFDPNNWTLQYARATGRLAYYNGSGTELWAIDGSGNVGNVGNLNVAGSIGSGAQINTVNLQVTGSAGFANHSDFALFQSGTLRIQQYASTWYWRWDESTGILMWMAGGAGYFWVHDNTSTQCYNQLGPVGGHGAYLNLSDERVKRNIISANVGLSEVMALRPIHFQRDNKDTYEIGFSAQQMQKIIPEAVSKLMIYAPETEPEERLTVSDTPIVAALVNAVQELANRVTTLEGHSG